MQDWLKNLPQYLLPKHWLTMGVYHLTRIETPWFKNAVIRGFIRWFAVDMTQAATRDYRQYRHFNSFFTRALRDDARPLANAAVVSPVDGAISQWGKIEQGQLVQAKGKNFSLEALLAGDKALATPFDGGEFITIYLSPKDYHRIHMPISGQLESMHHVPGSLFSVSPLTARMIPDLFARNERVINIFDSPRGKVALVMVGAVNVASMETVWQGVITPPYKRREIRRWHYQDQTSVTFDQGDEMGRFNMGSTVILLFEANAIQWQSPLRQGGAVKMGQGLAD